MVNNLITGYPIETMSTVNDEDHRPVFTDIYISIKEKIFDEISYEETLFERTETIKS